VFWCFGVLVFWCFGVLVFWCFGVLVFWCFGVLVFWCFGVLVKKRGGKVQRIIIKRVSGRVGVDEWQNECKTSDRRQIKRNVLFNGKMCFYTHRMHKNVLAPMR
jgi:hypothetical protein